MDGFGDKVGFVWSVADLLRGDYKARLNAASAVAVAAMGDMVGFAASRAVGCQTAPVTGGAHG